MSPHPQVGQWPGFNTEVFQRVDALRADAAQVGPVVAEIEDVDELLAVAQRAQGGLAAVEQFGIFAVFPVGATDPSAVSAFEMVQMRKVPAAERIIDSRGQGGEGVTAGGCEDPAGPGPQITAGTADEIDAQRKPGSGHEAILSVH